MAARGARARDRTRGKVIDLPFVLTTVVAGLLVAAKLSIQLGAGGAWDTYAFAANAAAIAGKSIGYVEPWRQPMLSLLTAPLYWLGPLRIEAIQFVDALVLFTGIIALYRILRRRFGQLPSTVGALAFPVVPMVWTWLGVGYLGPAAVAFSLWALLFFIKATEDDSRWYWAAIPMIVVVVMTRHAGLLFAFPALLWVLLRWQPFRQARDIAIGFGLAVLVYVPFGAFYIRQFDDVLYPFSVALGILVEQTARGSTVTTEPGGWPPAAWFPAGAIVWFAGLGLLSRLARWARGNAVRARRWFWAALAIAPAVLAQFGGGLASRQGTMLLAAFVIWRLLADREAGTERLQTGPSHVTTYAALDAVMLLWMLAYADHYVHHPVQLPRYLIPVAPGAIYLVILGLETWSGRLRDLLRPLHGRRAGVSLWRAYGHRLFVYGPVLVAVLVIAWIDVANTPLAPQEAIVSARQTAEWIRERENTSEEVVVYSDVWPMTSWYLGAEARPMPSFDETRAYSHELDKSGAEYYVTFGERAIDAAFAEATRSGDIVVLERTAGAPARPRILYLGDAWENYLESVCDYGFYLDSDSSAFAWGRSAFLDGYSAEEMAQYDAVAAYGVRWRDYGVGETALADYVRDGGSLVIDASANLDALDFPLLDISLLDTVTRRGTVARDAGITVAPDFALATGLAASIDAAPFVTEEGDVWSGASYAAMATAGATDVVAWAGDTPLVTVQELGQGRIYWIGANIVWHAFANENGEAALVRAVFDDAIAHSREGSR